MAPDPKIEQHGCAYIVDIVLVEVIADQEGCVAEARILKSSAMSLVDEAALTAVKTWVYLHARFKGEPVAGRFWELGRVSPGPLLSFSQKEKED